jgi:hypothetical protein
MGGSIFEGIAGGQQANANRALTQRQHDAEMSARDKDRALGATQLDPFAQQRSRQKQALLHALISGYQPANYENGQFSGGLADFNPSSIAQFFNPDAMASAEQAFQHTASSASPNYMPQSLRGAGYSEETFGKLPSLLQGTNPFALANFQQNNVRTPSAGATPTGEFAMPRSPFARRRMNALDPTKNYPV